MAREEGLLCGPSSGMNVVAAQKMAAKHPELHRIVTVVPDTAPPVVNSAQAMAYRERIVTALPAGSRFAPLDRKSTRLNSSHT